MLQSANMLGIRWFVLGTYYLCQVTRVGYRCCATSESFNAHTSESMTQHSSDGTELQNVNTTKYICIMSLVGKGVEFVTL